MASPILNKFLQILLQTAMRFYARKAVYTFDQTIKKLSNYDDLSIECDSCNYKTLFFDPSDIFMTKEHKCKKCR